MSQIQFLDWLDFYGKLHLSQQLQMSQVRRWPALKRVVYSAYSMRSIQEWCHCESKFIPVLHIVNVTSTVQHSLQYAHDVIAQIAEDQKDQFLGHHDCLWIVWGIWWSIGMIVSYDGCLTFLIMRMWMRWRMRSNDGACLLLLECPNDTRPYSVGWLNQIGSHLHDSQSFPKFLTLGSKNNCNEIIRIWD